MAKGELLNLWRAKEIEVNGLSVTVLQGQCCASHQTKTAHLGTGGQLFQEFQSVGKDCLKL